MSTNDVPGARAGNNDELAMGCWAEHDDGSLIFVESVEGSRVVYCIFDMSKSPPIQYRDAMPQDGFELQFTYDAKKKNSEKWTWHDKTPFPWEKVMKNFDDGPGYASVTDQLNAAQRVAESLKLRAKEVDKEDVERHTGRTENVKGIVKRLKRALRDADEFLSSQK